MGKLQAILESVTTGTDACLNSPECTVLPTSPAPAPKI